MTSDCSAFATPQVDCGVVLGSDLARRVFAPSRSKTIVFLVFISCLAVYGAVRSSDRLQGTDFPNFYCAARMVLDGQGHQLYNAELQRHYQARYAGGVGTLYAHPPFEVTLYLMLAWLSIRHAYLLWFALNLVILSVATRRLAMEALAGWDWHALFATSLIFVPVLLCLIQGQDSLLFLLLIVLSYTDLRSDRAFAAGCWLGLGLCKFQIALPLMAVLVITQRGKIRAGLAKGFGVIALLLAGVSAAISGWQVFVDYPRFLLSLQKEVSSGVSPQAMANFRGLVDIFLHGDQSLWALAATAILSACALIRATTVWKRPPFAMQHAIASSTQQSFDFSSAQTVIFALLVSYYLNPHDLTLLLIPIALLLHRILKRTSPWSRPSDRMTLALLIILFVPLLPLWALRSHFVSLLSVPMIGLFMVKPLSREENEGTI